MSDNEIYLLIEYIKSVLWRVAKRLSYKQDARCLKVKLDIQDVSHNGMASGRPASYKMTMCRYGIQSCTCTALKQGQVLTDILLA